MHFSLWRQELCIQLRQVLTIFYRLALTYIYMIPEVGLGIDY